MAPKVGALGSRPGCELNGYIQRSSVGTLNVPSISWARDGTVTHTLAAAASQRNLCLMNMVSPFVLGGVARADAGRQPWTPLHENAMVETESQLFKLGGA